MMETTMTVNAYLLFDGNCREAFEFYAKALGATIEFMMPHAGSPAAAHVGPEWADKILHASLVVQGQRIQASDAPPGRQEKPGGFYVSLNVDTAEEAERIFKEMSAGAKEIAMPMGETFWAERFAMFKDRYGIPWMVNGPGKAM